MINKILKIKYEQILNIFKYNLNIEFIIHIVQRNYFKFTLKASKVISLHRLCVEWKACLHLVPLLLNPPIYSCWQNLWEWERDYFQVQGVCQKLFFFHSHTRNMDLAPSRFGCTWMKYLFQNLCTVLIPDGSRPCTLSPGSNHTPRQGWQRRSCHG